jgi:Flp pilus assembly protein TadG
MISLRDRLRAIARPRRGQAMLETALVLPIFLLLVFIVLDLGRIVFLKAELENAVREGARLGRVIQPFDETPVQERVTAQAGLASATVDATCSGACDYGSTITVTATLPVSLVAGLVPALPGANLTASASVRIE